MDKLKHKINEFIYNLPFGVKSFIYNITGLELWIDAEMVFEEETVLSDGTINYKNGKLVKKSFYWKRING